MKPNDIFKNKQQKIADLLKMILKFLEDGINLGFDIDENLIRKVKTGICETENEKLRVVLVGGFSEGKTSIVAAWTENYDESKMKICELEATNEVNSFKLDDIEIIDTPGLFGLEENSNNERYKDITKKYISQAHLVLYIMNPNNPIKESHKSDLRWLFNDLKLLERTVFVLGRFDEEVDIDDEEDYRQGLEIRSQEIIDRLIDFKILNDEKDVKIVAVSSKPYGRDFSYWLNDDNIDDFRKISHIGLLQEATKNKIESLGDKNQLILSMQKSIVLDVLKKQLPIINENFKKISEEFIELEKLSENLKEDLKGLDEKIDQVRINLSKYIKYLFIDLILQAKGTNIDTFVEFFERNIGSEGIVLDSNIKNEFELQIGTALSEINKCQKSYNDRIDFYQSMIEKMAPKGVKLAGNFLKNFKIDKVVILGARDLLKLPIKFKPWGAVKLAKGINGAMPVIGDLLYIGVDVWEMWNNEQKKIEFKNFIDEVVKNLEEQRKELLVSIDNRDEFIKNFFMSYLELEESIDKIKNKVKEMEKQKEEFEIWKKTGEVIEVEFEELL